jgi:hypothetical protein
MKRQKSIARDKTGRKALRRVQSGLLPLETCPMDEQLQGFEQELTLATKMLGNMVEKMEVFDSYVSSGTCTPGLPGDLSSTDDIQKHLRRVFGGWAERQTGTWCDLDMDFKTMIKGKSKA